MRKPSSFVLELIKKITRAESMLKKMKKEHPVTCPVEDPHMAGACNCGADKHNSKIDEVLSELELK